MSLKLNERYPGRFDNPSADYPQGSFKNRTSPTAKDGSYLEKDWANDKEGFFQSLIAVAGITPSGIADKVGASQYYDALLSVLYAAARKTPVLTDTGTAGAYAAANTPALTALPSTGYMQRVKIANANTGVSTYAPDGLAAKPVYGMALQPLQGGELPSGVAVLMYLVQAGVNGGNGAWVIIESLGGSSQVAAATKSQHSVQLAQMAAVTGGMRNGKISVTAASATATFTADEVAVKTALGGQSWLLSSFSKAINLATTGAGGMDTGTAPVSGYVALYAIYNPTTATSALLATNATAARAAEVYGGVNMPAGYTASALVSVWATNSSSQFVIGSQMDRGVAFMPILVAQTAINAGSATPISAAPAVPKNATTCAGMVTGFFSTASSAIIYLGSDSSMSGQQGPSGYGTSGNQMGGSFSGIQLKTSQGVYYTFSGASCTLAIFISSYTF